MVLYCKRHEVEYEDVHKGSGKRTVTITEWRDGNSHKVERENGNSHKASRIDILRDEYKYCIVTVTRLIQSMIDCHNIEWLNGHHFSVYTVYIEMAAYTVFIFCCISIFTYI